MIRYFLRTLGVQVRAARSLYLLTVFGVALGVASVLAIQIINRNALAAFEGSVKAVSGDADLTVLGRTPTFAETLYVDVLAQPQVARAWPLYRVDVGVAGWDNVFLELVGIDLLQPVGVPLDSEVLDLTTAVTRRGWVAISPSLAGELHLRTGDSIAVTSGTRLVSLTIGALVDYQQITPLASRKLAVMDIGQAQALFGTPGQINQIDIRLTEGADPTTAAEALQAALGQTVDVLTPEQRERRATGLMGAFRINLTALSMISLFVGLFLIYSSTQASLLRRRTEFGLLRSLGATREQVFGMIAGEILLLGVLGVAVGLPLGYAVAATNVDLVSATLTNRYLLSEIETLSLSPWLYVLAGAIGVGGAVIGALVPALDLSRRDPNALLSPYTVHEKLGSLAQPLALAGVAVLVGSGLWYWLWGRSWQPAGFVLAVSLMAGLPLLTPFMVQRLSSPVPVRSFGLGYSIKSLAARLQATAVAVAALGIAVSMLTGITVMIGSFRRTVESWVGSTVQADIYITTPTWAHSGGVAPLDSTLVEELSRIPGVRSLDRLRGLFAFAGDRRVRLIGINAGSALPQSRFALFAGEHGTAWQKLREEGAVLVSEPLARKLDLWLDDTLSLTGPKGPVHFPIGGVYYDYSTESGAVAMDLGTLERAFGSGPINSIALYLDPGGDPERLVERLKQQYHDVPLLIRSNRRLREQVLRIFDQTFAITRVLQAMSLIIAVAGITLTLLVLARERLSELALFRALGAARRQIFTIFLGKGLSMALAALLLGTVGGLALAMILVFIVNRSYFGWTIQVEVPWRTLAEQAFTILAATAAASVYPAVRAAQTPATELSRDDL